MHLLSSSKSYNHQGPQPGINHAHKGNVDRVQAQVVGSEGEHHRVQPMGPQTNGPTPCMGGGGRRHILYYLWKAYKAAPDNEFIVYIKDLKSQFDDGRATFMAEDLMVCAKKKYKARLLDEENAWGKPTEEQEKIVAMTAEINSLKKE